MQKVFVFALLVAMAFFLPPSVAPPQYVRDSGSVFWLEQTLQQTEVSLSLALPIYQAQPTQLGQAWIQPQSNELWLEDTAQTALRTAYLHQADAQQLPQPFSQQTPHFSGNTLTDFIPNSPEMAADNLLPQQMALLILRERSPRLLEAFWNTPRQIQIQSHPLSVGLGYNLPLRL